jgi:hypothetical protein
MHHLLATELRHLLTEDQCIEVVIGIELRDSRGEYLNILFVSDKLLLLLDVIVALTEWRLPVLLVQVWVINLLVCHGARCGVTILKLSGWLIVTVALQVHSVLECIVPVQPGLIHFTQYLIHILYY